MNFVAMIWMLNVLSLGFESNHALEMRSHPQNKIFLYQLLSQLVISVLYFIIAFFVGDESGRHSGNGDIEGNTTEVVVYWGFFLALGLGLVVIFMI